MRRWIPFVSGIVVTMAVIGGGFGAYALNQGDGDSGFSFPGFSLVKPAFAEGEVPSFISNEIGLTAYIKMPDGSVDPQALLANMGFDSTRSVGDNFVFGTYLQTRYANSWRVQLFVYGDSDGWLMASLPTSYLASEAVVHTDVGSNTALAAALQTAAVAAGAIAAGSAIDEGDVNYYDFNYPDATDFALAENDGIGSVSVTLPSPDFGFPNDVSVAGVEVGFTSRPVLEASGASTNLFCNDF